ncbi:MAG: MOP flippase family protein [Candidatus Omnitrophica bacterium]|nr:MOP flippase family protein [Candidatus Omnitrophota bacterium]
MKIIKGLMDNKGTLAQKTARGGIWVFGSFFFAKVLFFIRTVILARLLIPNDFGMMGIAILAMTGMQVLTETGIDQAIIQKKGVTKDALDTAWVISVARGIILFIVLYLLSPAIAAFYNNLMLEPLLKVLSISFLFLGLQNIGVVFFQKELNFKKRALFTTATDVINIIFTVLFAVILKNVWAVVIGCVVGNLAKLIISYRIQAFRPCFKFNPKAAKELLKFGKHVFGASVMIFFVTQGDDALVGKMLGLEALGLYVLAYSLSNMPTTAITHVISQVSFPAYSKVQDDTKRLGRGYLKILKFTALLTIPLAAGLFILAPEFIKIVYGEKWLPMLPAVLIMCFLGFFRAIGATMGPVFFAVGKPHIQHKIKLCELITMIVIIYPLIKMFGIVGAALAGTFVYFLSLILHYNNLIKVIKGIKLEIFKTISKPLVLSLLMAVFIFLLKKHFLICINLSGLFFLSIVGLVFYTASIFFIDKEGIEFMKTTIKLIK